MSKQSLKIIYIFIISLLLIGVVYKQFTVSNNSELASAIHEGACLVDVRTSSEFESGSVEGAVNIPLGDLEGQLDKFKNKKQIIVFCRSGNRSSQAKSILERNGINNVIDGGPWEEVNKEKLKNKK